MNSPTAPKKVILVAGVVLQLLRLTSVRDELMQLRGGEEEAEGGRVL